LALDLGTDTGWACLEPERTVTHGWASFKPSRFQGGGMRYLIFRRWLDEFVQLAPFGEVVFEEVRRHAGVDASHIYGGLMATLTAWCEEKKIPYRSVPIGTWKKNLTGKGNANKEAVMAAVRSQGYVVETQDEADAIGILLGAVNAA
jgi:Holliday junction resolvasome RuvABC endonuclease subunit